jgi:hypothetical protein
MKSKLFITIAFVLLILLFVKKGIPLIGYYLGEVRFEHVPLQPGNIQIPNKRTYTWKNHSEITRSVISYWAFREIPDWIEGGKTKTARILLAKLAQKQDIEEVNKYLQNQGPRGRSGSTWLLHPEGDYDFTLTILTAILYLFGERPEILYPETTDHLLSTLLTEEGGEYRIKVPRSLGLVDDTENHYLMTEGSRYLKNRWMRLHGNSDPKYDNIQNGLEKWLISYLRELQEAGLYEFNSVPYQGFTLNALMNLEAFASDTVRSEARIVLDRLNWEYVVGSFTFRRFPPFRRQLKNSGIGSLNSDYHTTLMKIWMSRTGDSTPLNGTTNMGIHRALWGCLLSYQPPDKVVDWVWEKHSRYFITMGHGAKASPEIYSGGPGYLISAGGVHRGWRSLIVARPITLLIDDDSQDIDEVVHLSGPGANFTTWNNSGVYKNFACAAGPVHIPDKWKPTVNNDLWSMYRKSDSLSVAVHSQEDLGIICLFYEGNATQLLNDITEKNSNRKLLYNNFQFPFGERITYDTKSPKNKWVIVKCGNKELDRNFDRWALMKGEF